MTVQGNNVEGALSGLAGESGYLAGDASGRLGLSTVYIMKNRTRILLGVYLGIGVLCYTIIKILAGGLGVIGFGGPAGELLEFLIVVLAWPFVIVLSVLVVMQGR